MQLQFFFINTKYQLKLNLSFIHSTKPNL